MGSHGRQCSDLDLGPTNSIPVYGAMLEEDDIAAVDAALRRGWLGLGVDVSTFESAVATAIGATDRYPVAVSTGGAALHVAMMVAGCGPGDEVIVPSLCHLSNVQAMLATGAEPVFCDVDETMCIDPDRIAELIGSQTKAIVALDYGCNTCDHDAISALAAEHGLRVIHDAAHSFGSSSRGRGIGTLLVRLAEERARHNIRKARPGARVTLSSTVSSLNEVARQLLERPSIVKGFKCK